jgi:hypothetical protein
VGVSRTHGVCIAAVAVVVVVVVVVVVIGNDAGGKGEWI